MPTVTLTARAAILAGCSGEGPFSVPLYDTVGAIYDQPDWQYDQPCYVPLPTQQSVTARARIAASVTRSVTARTRIRTDGSQSVQARAYIVYRQDLTARAAIRATVTRAVTARAKIGIPETRTVTARARIMYKQDLQARALILNTVTKTVEARARVATIGVQAVTARAYIVYTQSVTARAKIQGYSRKRIAARCRIVTEVTQSVQARARLVSTVQTVSARAFITHDAWALARIARRQGGIPPDSGDPAIEGHVDTQITARAWILGATLFRQTVWGKARISPVRVQTVQSRARITLAAFVQARAAIAPRFRETVVRGTYQVSLTREARVRGVYSVSGWYSGQTVSARAAIQHVRETRVRARYLVTTPSASGAVHTFDYQVVRYGLAQIMARARIG
jgi:hypothetical protein